MYIPYVMKWHHCVCVYMHGTTLHSLCGEVASLCVCLCIYMHGTTLHVHPLCDEVASLCVYMYAWNYTTFLCGEVASLCVCVYVWNYTTCTSLMSGVPTLFQLANYFLK